MSNERRVALFGAVLAVVGPALYVVSMWTPDALRDALVLTGVALFVVGVVMVLFGILLNR